MWWVWQPWIGVAAVVGTLAAVLVLARRSRP